MVSQLHAWVNGHLVDAATATIPATDRGFRSGEGVFETLRCYGGHVFRLDAHLRRAVEGAEQLGIEVERELLAEAIGSTVRANTRAHSTPDTVVRLTLSAGPIEVTSAFPGTPTGTPTIVVTTHDLLADPGLAGRGIGVRSVALTRSVAHLKSVSYLAAIVAQRQARAAGADDALLVTDDAHAQVLEGAAGNVLAITGRRLHTPPDDGRLLAGIARAVVLASAADLGLEVVEAPLTLAELHRADEVAMTSSVREVVPVVAVDGRAIGDGRPGPHTATLHAAYRDEVRREAEADDSAV